jgi:hypothetical protein
MRLQEVALNFGLNREVLVLVSGNLNISQIVYPRALLDSKMSAMLTGKYYQQGESAV